MAEIDGPIVVRARDGMQQPLGRFLGDLAKQTGRPITEIAREAQISRAYYYVLRDSDQTHPSRPWPTCSLHWASTSGSATVMTTPSSWCGPKATSGWSGSPTRERRQRAPGPYAT